jgi:hypothetical protein
MGLRRTSVCAAFGLFRMPTIRSVLMAGAFLKQNLTEQFRIPKNPVCSVMGTNEIGTICKKLQARNFRICISESVENFKFNIFNKHFSII